MDSELYTRIINIFENYFQIKYNKDIININDNEDNISIIYKDPRYLIPRDITIKLFSLEDYSIKKNNKNYKRYSIEYKYLFYRNNKNNKIIIRPNIKTIMCKKTSYILHKSCYKPIINNIDYKDYYTSDYLYKFFRCHYFYIQYKIYIYNTNKTFFKLNKHKYYNNYNYKIIIIIFV